jgi:hypothetical protein
MQGPVAYVHPVVTEIYSIHHQAVQSFAERVNCADHDSLPKSREPSTRTMLQIRQEGCCKSGKKNVISSTKQSFLSVFRR